MITKAKIDRAGKSFGSGVYLVLARFGDSEVAKRVIYLK